MVQVYPSTINIMDAKTYASYCCTIITTSITIILLQLIWAKNCHNISNEYTFARHKSCIEFEASHSTKKPYTYLDDLKFNRAIRVLFIKTIRKNVLANYEHYIVDVPEQSSDIRQFDVVSYLSDQPEFMYSILSKFLDTQLFASFIDENAKRIQQSWLSIFDMDPEELSEHFTDKALDQAFNTADRIHLLDLRENHLNIEIKTVPASPMKIRRRVPALSAIANRLSYALSSNRNSIDCSVVNQSKLGSPSALNKVPTITSSPPIHRNSVATI